MAGYQIHEAAQEDIDQIWLYLAEESSPAVASQIENELFEAFSLLSKHAHMGFKRPRLTQRQIRFWVVRELLVAYAPDHHPLLIVAVVHGKRSPRTFGQILAERR